ncbi:hypothetical protein AMATHDRAFT_71988 [Amanita thiersii Skay4041]|uniref:CBF1-interacting co-repressor CIR N-terminal domain-containing protein n=1 Tax=Amanita thiersii Skay4041 TaxID=703135 RepID=A0A2A9NA39_9AGAR|nr:hypothetical protein AMATHDRAFT_71988 [Amanita thiersii Skay4041]
MGKLNIAHHKSYHPYRRDNIERVRRDEEEARLKEEKEEGRIMLADSEARIDRLRERAGITDKKKGKQKEGDRIEEPGESREGKSYGEEAQLAAAAKATGSAVLPTTDGHINFFADLEQSSLAVAIKATRKADPAPTDKGVPLAPTEKDLKPWYSERRREGSPKPDDSDEKRLRDTARKSVHDPLTSINHKLAIRNNGSSSTNSDNRFKRPNPPRPNSSTNPSSSGSHAPSQVQVRLTRESSERERALALIRKKKREMLGSATPSTVHGGLDEGDGYGDLFNRKEVEEAHRERERRRDRGWGDESWSSSSRHRPSRRW